MVHMCPKELLNKWEVNEKYKVKWTMDKMQNSALPLARKHFATNSLAIASLWLA